MQLSLPGAVSWADARFDGAPAARIHVESHSSSTCVLLHPADCALHRFLSAPLAAASPAAVRAAAAPHRTVFRLAGGLPAAALFDRLPDWRAPPQLS